jgi:DNA-binding beta-propeller fold protein YncE
MNTPSKILTALAVSVLLTACPGSGDSSSSTTTYTTIYGLAYDTTNTKLYVANAGRNTIQSIDPTDLASTPVTLAGGDNVSGTTNGDGTAARFYSPFGLAMNGTILLVADTGNSLLRKITSLVGTKTVANYATGGSFNLPTALAVSATDVYVADTNVHAIKKISLADESSLTWAGTSGTSGTTTGVPRANALFNTPAGIAVDTATGNVYVSDSGNHTIRKIDAAGNVTTIAGIAGTSGYKNSATGSLAKFNLPTNMVFSGNALYVTDTNNHAIRKIDTTTNAVTTFAGSAGTIDTDFTAASGSADGTGTAASFYLPRGIAIDGVGGNLYVSDQGLTKLRKITNAGVVTTFTKTF